MDCAVHCRRLNNTVDGHAEAAASSTWLRTQLVPRGEGLLRVMPDTVIAPTMTGGQLLWALQPAPKPPDHSKWAWSPAPKGGAAATGGQYSPGEAIVSCACSITSSAVPFTTNAALLCPSDPGWQPLLGRRWLRPYGCSRCGGVPVGVDLAPARRRGGSKSLEGGPKPSSRDGRPKPPPSAAGR